MESTNRILEIQARIAQMYAFRNQPYPQLPLFLRATEWVLFASEYAEASATVSKEAPLLWIQALQLSGQGVELALKACLGASNIEPPVEHDLVKLYCQVHQTGITASEFHQACIVHLSHFYHRDLGTGTKYKLRYPATRAESLGGAVPENEHFVSLIEDLCKQAQGRIDVASAALAGENVKSKGGAPATE